MKKDNLSVIPSKIVVNNSSSTNNSFLHFFKDHAAIILLIDPETGDIVYANESAAKFYGYSATQFCTMNFSEIYLLAPDQVKEEYTNAKEKKSNSVCRHKLADNTFRWVEVNSSLVTFTNQQFIFYIVIDITKIKESEETAQKIKNNFENLLNTSKDVFFSVDADFKILAGNHAFFSEYEKMSKTPPLRIGDQFFEALNYSEKQNKEWQGNLTRAFTGEIFTIENCSTDSSTNLIIWTETTFYPIYTDGFISAICLYSKNITSRKKINEELRIVKDRFEYFTKATEDGIYEWDIINDNLKCNDSYKKLFEFDVSNNVSNFSFWNNKLNTNDKERVLQSLNDSLKSSALLWQEEYKFKNVKGEYIYIKDIGTILRDDSGNAVKILGAVKNISEEKKDFLQLKLFEFIINNTSEGIMITESSTSTSILNNHGILFTNDAFTKMTGYSKEELIGRSPNILQGPETETESKILMRIAIENDKSFITDITNYKKNGVKFINRIYGSPVKDELNKTRFFISMQNDVTEERRNELLLLKLEEEKIKLRAIQESEEKYSNLANSMYEILYTTDMDGNWTFLNYTWERQLGYTVEESLNTPIIKYLHPDDVSKNIELFAKIIQGKKEYCKHSIRYISKSGVIKWMEAFSKIHLSSENEVIGTTGTLRDITVEKSNRHYYELLANNISDMICVFDIDKNVLYISPSVTEILGYSIDAVKGKNVLDFVHPEDVLKVSNIFNKKISVDLAYKTETIITRFLDKEKQYKWVETSINFVFDKYALIGTIITNSRVIDDRIKIENKLEQALQTEKKVNELKSKFITIASHEFKTPLTVIKSSVEILQAYINKGKKEINFIKFLSLINNEIDNLTKLLNDILIKEKFESNKIIFSPQSFDIFDFINKIISKLNFDSKKHKINIICEEPNLRVIADPLLMEKIITNLISNALKYSKGNKSPIIEIKNLKNEIKISIIDFGIGIPANERDFIFTPFFRANNAKNIEGTGLGLSIVKDFIEMHKGKIEIKSKENFGTKIILHFPQHLKIISAI